MILTSIPSPPPAWAQFQVGPLTIHSNVMFGIPANIWASLVAIALGIALIIVQGRRHPEPETSVYRDGRLPDAVTVEPELQGADRT